MIVLRKSNKYSFKLIKLIKILKMKSGILLYVDLKYYLKKYLNISMKYLNNQELIFVHKEVFHFALKYYKIFKTQFMLGCQAQEVRMLFSLYILNLNHNSLVIQMTYKIFKINLIILIQVIQQYYQQIYKNKIRIQIIQYNLYFEYIFIF